MIENGWSDKRGYPTELPRLPGRQNEPSADGSQGVGSEPNDSQGLPSATRQIRAL